ncbi:PDDEXK nuclease domain-containing protein [Flavobacterium sp. UBA6135]|uniref:PDDEXK nuclease domain-containing protein n=1 Tax=Flavobacterium sp. UBA6135 TaxID=1946553 RepID=UPI0025C45503|nr:PDDEXK nuclease domain-containing protein [Flavobacterium sp. UBA6135]
MNLQFSKYQDLIVEIKNQILSSQQKAALSVNKELILLYWNIGKMIFENQSLLEGRNNYIDQLSKDIKSEFPHISGFSRTNLFNIRKFYIFYVENSIQQLVGLNQIESIQQAVGLERFVLIPWGHHVLILEKTKTKEEAFFYINETIKNNWSRAILALQLKQNLFERQGKSINNFDKTLKTNQAELVNQLLKDPYNFDFLTLEAKVHELEIEKQLTENITKFLLELGKGFAFVGRQYPIEIGKKSYSLDLLFYHINLKCYIVIELKTVEFEPEFAGKLNFYLSAVDDILKTENENPSIGILLCNGKDGIEVEYALKDINKPIGVSEYTFTEQLPKIYEKNIPTVNEFEKILKENS